MLRTPSVPPAPARAPRRARPPRPGPKPRLKVDALEDRATPAIWWVNQFNDGFDTYYGPNAAAARAVVNQAITDWAEAITDFHYFQGGLNNTFTATISAASLGDGVRGETQVTRFEPETARPTHATIRLDNDGAGPGWYFDPTPADSGEFVDTQNPYMAFRDAPGADLYRTVAHELGHALGFVVFQGGAIDQHLEPVGNNLFTIRTPGPVDNPIATFDLSSHLYGGEGAANFFQSGPISDVVARRDLMNPGGLLPAGRQTRQLISSVDLQVLEWGYGYTVNYDALRQFTPARHGIGTYRPPAAGQPDGQFHLTEPWNGATAQFDYLPVDHRAIAGDWDGDGVDEVGSYYAPDGVFHLRLDDFTTEVIDFASPQSYPVAGDWDGDGIDDVGVYYPNLARFDLLVRSPTSGYYLFSSEPFGGPTFMPVAGDWDGDGVDDLGLYDPAQALFRIRNRDGSKFSVAMGGSTALPLAGDWDGDGDDEVGTYFRAQGRFVLRSNNVPADTTKSIVDFGGVNSTKLPLAGNWF